MIIPVDYIHRQWHHIYEEDLELVDLEFEDIVDKDSEWRTNHSEYKIIN